MREILGRFSIVLLIGLLLVKVSAFHVYEHHDSLDDSNDHCELCVLTIEGQQTESLTPSKTVMECVPLLVASRHETTSVVEVQLNAIEEGIPFSRPPPHLLA